MTLSREQAEDALRDVERAARRSTAALGYRMSSPHLIWWGLIWLIGYGAMAAGRDCGFSTGRRANRAR